MSEPSPNPADQIAAETAALTNGTAPAEIPTETPADIEMADSMPAADTPAEPIQEVHVPHTYVYPPLNIPSAPAHRPNRTTHTRAN
jgi:hypothetical protein